MHSGAEHFHFHLQKSLSVLLLLVAVSLGSVRGVEGEVAPGEHAIAEVDTDGIAEASDSIDPEVPVADFREMFAKLQADTHPLFGPNRVFQAGRLLGLLILPALATPDPNAAVVLSMWGANLTTGIAAAATISVSMQVFLDPTLFWQGNLGWGKPLPRWMKRAIIFAGKPISAEKKAAIAKWLKRLRIEGQLDKNFLEAPIPGREAEQGLGQFIAKEYVLQALLFYLPVSIVSGLTGRGWLWTKEIPIVIEQGAMSTATDGGTGVISARVREVAEANAAKELRELGVTPDMLTTKINGQVVIFDYRFPESMRAFPELSAEQKEKIIEIQKRPRKTYVLTAFATSVMSVTGTSLALLAVNHEWSTYTVWGLALVQALLTAHLFEGEIHDLGLRIYGAKVAAIEGARKGCARLVSRLFGKPRGGLPRAE